VSLGYSTTNCGTVFTHCTVHRCATAFNKDSGVQCRRCVRLGRHFLMWIDGRTATERPINGDLSRCRGSRRAGPGRAGEGRASWVARSGTSLASDNAVVTMNAPTCIKRHRPPIVARSNHDLWQRGADRPVDAGGKSTEQVPCRRDSCRL